MRCWADKKLVIGGQLTTIKLQQPWDSMPDWAAQARQPVTYSFALAQLVEQRGISTAALLRHGNLPQDLLADPTGRLSLVDALRIFVAAIELTQDYGLGFELGLNTPITAHGSLGFAIMAAPTLREAMKLMERFWELRSQGVLLVVSGEDHVLAEMAPRIPLAPLLRDMLFSSMLANVYHGIGFLMPSLSVDAEIWLQGSQPEGIELFQDRLPPVRFNMPCAGIRLSGDLNWLDLPLLTANPESFAHSLRQCEQELALLDTSQDLLTQTRTAMTLGDQGYPSLDQLAEQFHLTPRTFRRRLSELGSNYQQLLEGVRRRDSAYLLSSTKLDIRIVGERLGYQDPANFTRAFKQWTGITPREWRRQWSQGATVSA